MANSDALKDVRRRLGRRVRRTGGWIGLVHGPSDDRTRIFGWLAQVASSFDGDRTPNNNEELLMAMNLLDEVFCKTACESLARRQLAACAALRLAFKWTGKLGAALGMLSYASQLDCTVATLNEAEINMLQQIGWNVHNLVSAHEVLHALWPTVRSSFSTSTRKARGLDRAVDALIVAQGDARTLRISPVPAAVAAIGVAARLLDVELSLQQLLAQTCCDQAEMDEAFLALETFFEIVSSILPERVQHKLRAPNQSEFTPLSSVVEPRSQNDTTNDDDAGGDQKPVTPVQNPGVQQSPRGENKRRRELPNEPAPDSKARPRSPFTDDMPDFTSAQSREQDVADKQRVRRVVTPPVSPVYAPPPGDDAAARASVVPASVV